MEGVDMAILAGDINSKISMKKDYIDNIDDVKGRNVMDDITNQMFIDFFLESRMCVLNSTFEPWQDGFTSIPNEGISVVHYIVTRIEDMDKIKDFRVETCTSIIQKI